MVGDLVTATPLALRVFINSVADLAFADQEAGEKARSGDYLCERFAKRYRKGHVRLASSIYRKIRWSLDLAKEESDQ